MWVFMADVSERTPRRGLVRPPASRPRRGGLWSKPPSPRRVNAARNPGGSMSNKLRVGVLAVAALALGSASAVSAASPSPESAEGGATIAVVTHGQASDPFWSVFKRGVDDAAAQMGATATYSAPAEFDMVEMASLIDAAVATEPDGLVVSVPDYPALQDSLAAANEAGIPIITVNSGSDNYQDIGAITHIGQDETIAGRAAGARLAEAGATNVICINQESRQCRARRPLRRRRRRRSRKPAARIGGRAGRPQRRCRSTEHDQLDAAGRRHDRRDPRPRPDGCGTGAGRRRGARAHRRHPRSPRSTSAPR